MIATTCYSYIEGPLGRMLVRGDGQFITGLFLPQHKGSPGPDASWKQCDAPFAALREQLAGYFAGKRQQFDVALKLAGTPFQQHVWQELRRIPFGTTITYGDLARRVGKPTASRAVGHANGRNPVSIIVPCHRVVGADQKLTGYAGGIDKKRWLLDFEGHAMGVESSCLSLAGEPPCLNGRSCRA
ncbi:MAG: methylated-DNA--[protein]-cysteine S-methyltransferase [Gemmataceae bacterium]|nr:methylated-DNA--[protein]-cysteine S-methyltransferase [Gemmataceae bacterium]